MRYLRMLTNSAAAAALATMYVIALVLHLNPALPLAPGQAAPLVTTVGVYYAVHLTALAYALLVFRQLLSRELFSPAWISIGVLVWLGAAASAVGALLMRQNLSTFGLVLDPRSADGLARSAVALAIATVLFLMLALARRRMPEARAVWAPLLILLWIGSAATPIALRGRGTPAVLDARPIDMALDAAPVERPGRVAIIAIDGGSLDFITSAAAEGRLPNFGRLLDGGAVRHLATLHPTSADAVWAAVATGKLPQKNGVHSAAVYRLARGTSSLALQLLPDYCFAHGLVRFGFLLEEPHSSATIRTQTLWSILSASGFTVGVVGWPLTQPAPTVRGYLVADTYHRATLTASDIANASALYPPELQRDAIAAMDAAVSEGAPLEPASSARSAGGRESSRDLPAQIDRIYERVGEALDSVRPAQVRATRYQSLDAIGHYYLRFAAPSDFGDVTEDERRRLGAVLERHYDLIDAAVGRAMALIGPDDLLVVVSAYGMEPLTFGKRVLERVIGDPDLSGTHDAAPDGFLMAYGASVARGRHPARASVVDVLPTLLYFMGLPIGRDMDGYARTDLFKRSFLEERPITYIPTYDR